MSGKLLAGRTMYIQLSGIYSEVHVPLEWGRGHSRPHTGSESSTGMQVHVLCKMALGRAVSSARVFLIMVHKLLQNVLLLRGTIQKKYINKQYFC